MGKMRSFESFSPSHTSLVHFFIRDKETDNPILSLNQQTSALTHMQQKGWGKGIPKSKLPSGAWEDGQRQLQGWQLPTRVRTHIPAHSPNRQQLFRE